MTDWSSLFTPAIYLTKVRAACVIRAIVCFNASHFPALLRGSSLSYGNPLSYRNLLQYLELLASHRKTNYSRVLMERRQSGNLTQ